MILYTHSCGSFLGSACNDGVRPHLRQSLGRLIADACVAACDYSNLSREVHRGVGEPGTHDRCTASHAHSRTSDVITYVLCAYSSMLMHKCRTPDLSFPYASSVVDVKLPHVWINIVYTHHRRNTVQTTHFHIRFE